MLDLRNVGLISASTRSNEGDELPAPDFPSKPENQPDSICAREQLRGVLGEAMKTLPERYQKVVVLYYTNEMTMKEIGGVLGINESRVSQIHKSALEKMHGALQANGITSSQASKRSEDDTTLPDGHVQQGHPVLNRLQREARSGSGRLRTRPCAFRARDRRSIRCTA